MTARFDAAALERGYAFLDDCPAHLLPDVVTFPDGTLEARVRGVCRWRTALLDGSSPPADAWPTTALSNPVRRALDELGIARFCKGNPDLVDDVLRDVLAALARHADVLSAEVSARLRELETLERSRAAAPAGQRGRASVTLDDGTLRALRAQSQADVDARPRDADAAVIAMWGERVRAWSDIADVFGDLSRLTGRGWDLTQSVLRHAGWRDLLRLRALVETLPQLREVVRSLGRLQQSSGEPSISERVFGPVRRIEEYLREVRTPNVPHEVRGVERSGEVARMLPVEAAMLGHPVLRLVWHARRAERALNTYRVEGVALERALVERDVEEAREVQRPRPERGPIVAVIDTSGSMQGLPEQVAKALVLEALRTAHAERRPCVLYLFGSRGQVVEHTLSLTADGIGALLAFLGGSFGAGTDVSGVVAKLAARLHEDGWSRADVLLVSDGEWAASAEVIADATRAKEGGARFHGVQVGNRGRTGLHAICDPVHVFTDWSTAGGC